MGLLAEQERQVVRRHAAALAGIEKEPITKSYKLVTLQALLQMDALRTGADVAEIAWTAHRIVTGDPRLLADTASAEMPDPASVNADTWRDYWLNWPLSAWAGRLRGASAGWFRIDGRRFIPTFQVAGDMSETFDANARPRPPVVPRYRPKGSGAGCWPLGRASHARAASRRRSQRRCQRLRPVQ